VAVAIRLVQTSMYPNRPIMKRLHKDTASSVLRSMNVLYPALTHHSSRNVKLLATALKQMSYK
jgi:hypothetical protein